MTMFNPPKPRRVALHYGGIIYEITIQQVYPGRFRAEWVKPTPDKRYQVLYHTKADKLEAHGSTPAAAQGRLLMRIDPVNIHLVRDIDGTQLT